MEALASISPDALPDDSAVICRNNAPLFRAAFAFLSAGRGVSVAGSDIGHRLVGTLRKLGDESFSQAQTESAIDLWLEEKLARGSKTAADMAECMRVFVSHATTLGSAVAYAEHLFSQRGSIHFSTGHKAKGLEWDCVYHLDSFLCGHDEQDANLRYVIDTRSKDRLFMIDGNAIR